MSGPHLRFHSQAAICPSSVVPMEWSTQRGGEAMNGGFPELYALTHSCQSPHHSQESSN